MSAKKHNKIYLSAWGKFINQKGASACILLSIDQNDKMLLNTLDISKDILIDQLQQAIEVLEGTREAEKTRKIIE